MGTDTKGKQEVGAKLSKQATVFADKVAQSISIGEVQHAVGEGLIKDSGIIEIGAVINGTHAGRSTIEEITLFDGSSVGLQDLAVATSMVELAIAQGSAIKIDF